jgi:DNA modification methylase
MNSNQLDGLAVTYLQEATLKRHALNARIHSAAQVKDLVKSMKAYGWTNPVLVDENRNVLAGHGRLEAAKVLGISEVPTICLSHMSAAQKRAYIIADNRLSETAGSWDRNLLALEHEAIRLIDPSFDLSSTGFSLDEIEVMLDSRLDADEDDAPLPDRSVAPTSALGDLWILGEHRLLCGDALLEESFEKLLGDERAQLVIADPPYNVKINGHVSGEGKHAEFAMASGEMTTDEFEAFLTQAFSRLISFSANGSIHYLFMDWRHLAEMALATGQYTEFKNLICWNKSSAGMGSFYRSKHELIFVMKNGDAKHINNFGLGAKGRYRTNVWDYPGLSGWGANREAELAMHPTVKPLTMIMDALKDCSKKWGIVLDPFGGSGTTMIAAERTGRRARLIELDPAYVDVSISRWQSATGGKATLGEEGPPFDSIRKGRT